MDFDPRPLADRARRPSGPRAVITALFAIMIAAVLQFAAIAKILTPSLDPEKQTTLLGLFDEPIPRDYAIAVFEIVVLMLILAVQRWKITWVCSALMFAGFTGYAGYYTIRNESCGCFGGLWQPPNGFSFTVDVIFAIGSVCLVMAWGLRAKAVLGVLIAMPLLAGLGFAFAQSGAPPKKAEVVELLGGTGPELLKAGAAAVPGAAEAFAATEIDPAHYIFIHDPSCHTCEELKIACVDQDQEFLAITEDPFLRVHQLDVFDLRDALEIPETAWLPTPAVLVVYAGEVVAEWNGEAAPCPGTSATQGGPPNDDGVYAAVSNFDFESLRAAAEAAQQSTAE